MTDWNRPRLRSAPRVIKGPLPQSGTPDNIRCQIEGYVRRARWDGKTHLRFEVIAGEMVVRTVVLTAGGWDLPEDSYVRVTGVFSPKFGPDKKLLDAQMTVPRPEDVELLETSVKCYRRGPFWQALRRFMKHGLQVTGRGLE